MKNAVLLLAIALLITLTCDGNAAKTMLQENLRGASPQITVTGARNHDVPSGSPAIALNGTKLFPGEVGSGITTQSFTIHNTGAALLQLENPPVRISGSPALTISQQPFAQGILPGGSADFIVQFDRSVFGTHVATIEIPNNTGTTPLYRFPVEGRTYNAGPPEAFSVVGHLEIPDSSTTGVDIPFMVSGLTGKICTLQFRANGTNCTIGSETGIQHSWVGDLVIKLTSPAGKVITLVDSMGFPGSALGTDGDHFCNTVLDDKATSYIEDAHEAEAPFSGVYKPNEPLYEVTGDVPNGIWTLNVADRVPQMVGYVNSVSLIFTVETSATAAEDWQLLR